MNQMRSCTTVTGDTRCSLLRAICRSPEDPIPAPNRLVDIAEVVRGVERVGRPHGTLGRDLVPVHEQPHDARTDTRGRLDLLRAIVRPAEARIVVEAHPHAVRRAPGGRGERCKSAQGGDYGNGDDNGSSH